MKRATLFFLSILFSFLLNGQTDLNQLTANLKWRNIGPANQGGRIVDIEALDNDFTKVFIATGSGGVFKSVNAGNSWTPIFDDYETASIGDIAVHQQNPDLIWVGTGEANNRNSVSWGNGVYKSNDGGESFVNVGLESTHAIARILTHPDEEDELCVCATGHLWGYSGERGLFMTSDGGKNWKKITNGLPDDGKTGCTDLIRDPENPKIMYAAMYHRRRMPWHFHSGGENGGIFKSTDGGRNWTKLTNGLPAGPTGRIGLAISRSNPKVVMALIEAERSDKLSKPGSGVYRSEDGGKSWKYVNTYNNRPFYYSQIRINPIDDQRVYILTTRFMVSEDGGKTLRNGSEDEEIHGDFHAMWLDPNNKDRYYMGADKGISLTHDHGEHFFLLDNLAIAQFYRIGYDMRDPYYVYGGLQDNGMYGIVSFSRDARGILNDSNWKLHWGDGQYVMSDPTNWRDVFTSAENGSFFHYDPVTHRQKRISPNAKNIVNYEEVKAAMPEGEAPEIRYNWTAPFRMSPHDPNTLFAAGNFLFKSNDKGHSWSIISPDLSTDHPRKRKEGLSGGITPDNTGAETHCTASTMSISPITEDIIWVGTDDGNVQLTRNGGQNWKNVRAAIPNVPDSLWVSRIEASHFDKGTAYVSFDGHRSDNFGTWIYKTTDFGSSWTSLRANLPEGEVVRVVREDHKNPNLLFIGTETGVWFTIDGGQNWERLKNNMPTVSVYDIKIHPRDNDLIVGTHGRSIWVLDDITPLQQLTDEVLDNKGYLFSQRRATIWENVSRGGQRGHFWYAGDNPETITNTSSLPRAEIENNAWITFYIGQGVAEAELTISNLEGNKQRTISLAEASPGIHRFIWNMEYDIKEYTAEQAAAVDDLFRDLIERYGYNSLRRTYERYQEADNIYDKRRQVQSLTTGFLSLDIPEEYRLPKAGPGVYKVTLKVGDEEYIRTLEIREDPLLKE